VVGAKYPYLTLAEAKPYAVVTSSELHRLAFREGDKCDEPQHQLPISASCCWSDAESCRVPRVIPVPPARKERPGRLAL
jgi:hypothetical protein